MRNVEDWVVWLWHDYSSWMPQREAVLCIAEDTGLYESDVKGILTTAGVYYDE